MGPLRLRTQSSGHPLPHRVRGLPVRRLPFRRDMRQQKSGGDLDIEDDNPLYSELAQTAMEIVESIHGGLRRYDNALMLDYRDWPATIKNVDTGAVLYPTAL